MRDTFDGYSSLDVSQDESGASMGNDLCCCKDGAQTSEQCSLVSIEYQQYIVAKGNGESKWTCPNGYVMASQTRFTNPPTCSGSKKKHWQPDWMYEPSLEALRVSSTVYVRDPFAGVTSDSNPYDLEEGVKGKVVGVNKDGTFNVEFPDVGVVVLNTDKLSNLCRNPPTSVETEGTDGGEGAKLKAKSFLKDAMEAQVSVLGAGNVLGQLQAAISECELAGIEAATDRDLFEAYERRIGFSSVGHHHRNHLHPVLLPPSSGTARPRARPRAPRAPRQRTAMRSMPRRGT
jgi:hypothetical protein